eukprot:7423160-Alexandrium_andersonii.AAC.1
MLHRVVAASRCRGQGRKVADPAGLAPVLPCVVAGRSPDRGHPTAASSDVYQGLLRGRLLRHAAVEQGRRLLTQ